MRGTGGVDLSIDGGRGVVVLLVLEEEEEGDEEHGKGNS